ncbi:unnamed protein product, partial [Linum tenue]
MQPTTTVVVGVKLQEITAAAIYRYTRVLIGFCLDVSKGKGTTTTSCIYCEKKSLDLWWWGHSYLSQ